MERRREERGRERRPMAREVERKEERVGAQTSTRERRGPTGRPRIEVEGEIAEGGQRGGRVGGEGGGQIEGVTEHLGGLSSPPKQLQKVSEMREKGRRKEGEEERMERSST